MKKNGPAFEAIGSAAADGDFNKQELHSNHEFHTDAFDWWSYLVEFIAGPNHGLSIGVISDSEGELVEIRGSLPSKLRKGLHRHAPWHGRGYVVEWYFRPDGYGTRYELNGLGDLLNRLAERKAMLHARGAK